jgi:hypothetical protein
MGNAHAAGGNIPRDDIIRSNKDLPGDDIGAMQQNYICFV